MQDELITTSAHNLTRLRICRNGSSEKVIWARMRVATAGIPPQRVREARCGTMDNSRLVEIPSLLICAQ